MYKRFIYEDWTMIFPVVAFAVAACIFVFFVWRALRMKRPQVERFENLPFNDENPSRHDIARQ
ncbi:MAG: hypothetical protein QM715_20700 [Nibricoccus sp.]